MADWDGDGRPGLIITRTNEPVLVLAPREAPNGRAFAVKLTGEPGNPDAIGARIIVNFKDGTVQAVELAAGSGYLTQSEPLAFFSYASGNAPTAIKVIWPDGARTNHPFQPGVPRVVLTKMQ